tara:strand:+ start:3054 stop:3728 length:675 start_codon:yes stop_codon:yes gene_type:complete
MNLTKAEKSFTIFFLAIVLLELITSNVKSLLPIHIIAKPLILLSLIFFFINQGKHLSSKTKVMTLLALLFSLAGDVLLMFIDISASFFLSGLVAFLLAHIMYIMVFLDKKNSKKTALIFITVLLIYAIGIFYLLKDGLGDMLIPVIVYMLVILTMVLTSTMRKDNVSKQSYNLVFLGAIFFVISDSFLAINKFYQPVPLSKIIIMSTYSLAQYLIVLGLLKQHD